MKIIHREPITDESALVLVLVQDERGRYIWVWGNYVGRPWPNKYWTDIDGLAREAVRLVTTHQDEVLLRLGRFLRSFVGEERYILATLESL